MAKLTLEHGATKMTVEGDSIFVAEQRDAFFDFLSKQEMKNESPQICQAEHVASKKDQLQRRIPTWTELKQAADEGRLSELVKSGDRLPLTLKNGDQVDLDVGQDESGKTYFVFHNGMAVRRPMNSKCTNKGGWYSCKMRRYANEDVYDLLPDEVKSVIVPTRIVQMIDGERIETHDKLFCLSATQMLGKDCWWSKQEPEDTQIDIFRDPPARIKQAVGKATASWWWLRSAYSTNSFGGVNSDGYTGSYLASSAGGVALSFCIEESN